MRQNTEYGLSRKQSRVDIGTMKQYFHGATQKAPYFEGWYLKLQTKEGKALALIPALHIDGKGRRSASLQVITESRSWWLAYELRIFGRLKTSFLSGWGQAAFVIWG